MSGVRISWLVLARKVLLAVAGGLGGGGGGAEVSARCGGARSTSARS